VLAFHGAWIGLYLGAGHEPRDFIKIGTIFQGASNNSRAIKVDPSSVPPRNRGLSQGNGYDGQFSYYMALDFTHARSYMDYPSYRYSRVLYPVLARALSFGNPGLVPAALIVINWLALGGATLALAVWFRRRRLSPWLALLVGLYPGLLLGVQRDLTEPLAYALVAAGIYLFDFGGRRRLLWSGLAFGLAGLARQTTIVFPLCLVAAILLSGDRDEPVRDPPRTRLARAIGFGLLALGPIIGYTAYLNVWLGSLGKGASLERVPFEGLFAMDWELARQPVVLVWVITPSLIVAGVVLAALRRRLWRVEFAYLLGNVLVFVVFLGRLAYHDGYTSVGRVTTGVVLAAVVCLPWLWPLGQSARRALVASFVLWLSLLPVVTVYGFGG
jgi:hypothetical protein